MEGEERIREAMGPRWRHVPVKALKETDSTNLRLKEAARAGRISPPFLLTADCQTAGRGRLGRQFVSPAGTGLYMSLLLPPIKDQGPGVTFLAAVAVCRALEEETGVRPWIKWVNDLFVQGKKVCGILAEGISEGIIVGIGVNLRTPPGGFPPEAGLAGALDTEADRFSLAGRIAAHLLSAAETPEDAAWLNEYRERMFLTGQRVRYTVNGAEKEGLVRGVAPDGGLLVSDEAGESTLKSGEVTLGSQSVGDLLYRQPQ